MAKIKAIATIDGNEVKSLSFVNVNGTLFFGKVEEADGKVKVTNAVTVSDASDIVAVVKEWVKAKNTNSLKNPVFGGSAISFAKEELGEAAQLQIDGFVAQANYKLQYALSDLANDIIDGI